MIMREIAKKQSPSHCGEQRANVSKYCAAFVSLRGVFNKALAYPSDGLRRDDWRYLADSRGSGGKPPAAHHVLEQFGNHGAAMDGQGNRRPG